jgi:adenosylmethionine-8-amino-7-oxononanoate aminotransferase
MVAQPAGYLKRIRELCTKYDVLLIADEVATGFGRTGKMFACQHEHVTPDFMAVSKGLTGGYMPLAATLTTDEIYRAFLGRYEEFKTFFHGHSYTGNPLGCAVALANLEIFRKEKTLARLRPKIKALAQWLIPFAGMAHVGDIRQRGLMVGIELVRDKTAKEPYHLGARVGQRIAAEARRRGLLIRPIGNVLVLMPPLSTSMGELKRMVELLRDSMDTLADDQEQPCRDASRRERSPRRTTR